MSVQPFDERFHAIEASIGGLSQPERTVLLHEVLDSVGVRPADTVAERFAVGTAQYGSEDQLLSVVRRASEPA